MQVEAQKTNPMKRPNSLQTDPNLMINKKFPIFGAVIHHFFVFFSERRSYSRYVN
jgi:hypothetical protein